MSKKVKASRKPAVTQPKAVISIQKEPGAFDDLDTVIRPFAPVLTAMRRDQRMTMELRLPAHLWLMLNEVAEQDSENYPDVGVLVSELVFRSHYLRAMWFEAMECEGEMLPQVIDELRTSKKLIPKVVEQLAKTPSELEAEERAEKNGGAR